MATALVTTGAVDIDPQGMSIGLNCVFSGPEVFNGVGHIEVTVARLSPGDYVIVTRTKMGEAFRSLALRYGWIIPVGEINFIFARD